MTEKPIIFSGPMVRAILDGRKTQTRRVLKPQPIPCLVWGGVTPGKYPIDGGEKRLPYASGDRLWVREAWRVGSWDHERCQMCVDFKADGVADPIWRDVPDPDWFEKQWIKIGNHLIRSGMKPDADGHYAWARGDSRLPWQPSIHMPRWASRITLPVTAVKVERLQDISEEDARAEGVGDVLARRFRNMEAAKRFLARTKFQELWQSIYAKKPGHAWEDNPWVAAATFERAT